MEDDLDHEDCEVKVFKNAKLEGRPCTHFQVIEKTRRPDSRFRLARVLVDNEYTVPVYYAAFGWGKDDELVPLEEYAYTNLQINIGLTDLDFDIENPDYHFQSLDESTVSD